MSPWSRSIALGMSTVTSHMQAGALLSTRICEKHVGAGCPKYRDLSSRIDKPARLSFSCSLDLVLNERREW